jgi:protein gp37
MSDIEWTGRTNNVLAGCSPQSPGCRNCYAENSCHRFHEHYDSKPGLVQIRGRYQKHDGITHVKRDSKGNSVGQGARWTGEIRCLPHKLLDPLGWAKGEIIFANSVSDLFHRDLVDHEFGRHFIAAYFGLMVVTPQHTYQCLTKQPDQAIKLLEWAATEAEAQGISVPQFCVQELYKELHRAAEVSSGEWATKFTMAALDVGCRWKLAGGEEITPIDIAGPDGSIISWAPTKSYLTKLRRHHAHEIERHEWPRRNIHLGASVEDCKRKSRIDQLRQLPAVLRFLSIEPLLEDLGELDLDGIGWVICGGESGQHARPCDIAWLRSIVEQCKAARVPVFCKQLGAKPMDGDRQVCMDDAKGGDIKDPAWPEDLRVQEMPR